MHTPLPRICLSPFSLLISLSFSLSFSFPLSLPPSVSINPFPFVPSSSAQELGKRLRQAHHNGKVAGDEGRSRATGKLRRDRRQPVEWSTPKLSMQMVPSFGILSLSLSYRAPIVEVICWRRPFG